MIGITASPAIIHAIPAPVLSGARNGSEIDLSWSAVAQADDGYEVWRSPANKYWFEPETEGTLLTTTALLAYTVGAANSGIGDVSNHYSFLVRAKGANTISAPSTRVAEYDQTLRTTASTDNNYIALIVLASGVTTAAKLAEHIEANNSNSVVVSTIGYYDRATSAWVDMTYTGGGAGTNDFAILPMQGLRFIPTSINGVNNGSTTIWTQVGSLPPIGDTYREVKEYTGTSADHTYRVSRLETPPATSGAAAKDAAIHNSSGPSTWAGMEFGSFNAIAQSWTSGLWFDESFPFGDIAISYGEVIRLGSIMDSPGSDTLIYPWRQWE